MLDARDPRVIEEFHRRRTRQFMLVVPVVLTVLLLAWLEDHRSAAPFGIPAGRLMPAAFLAIVAAVFFFVQELAVSEVRQVPGQDHQPEILPALRRGAPITR
jgi:hypothetical protein